MRLLTAYISLLGLLLIAGCRPYSGAQGAAEAGYEFGGLNTYTITGGDTEGAELTGFERDAFNNLFARAVRSVLNERGMTELNTGGSRARQGADIIVRYTLRERLLITILDADTRRLIWRGEAADKFNSEDLKQESIDTTVRDILNGFPR